MPIRSSVKTLKINGKDVSGHEEESVLQVAHENNIHIPTLCALEGLSLVGACRLCLVEVKGWNRLVPACTTYVEEGMEIETNSEKLQNYRRMIVELLFAEGNHVCSVCVVNGRCDLQNLASELGMTHVRFPLMGTRSGLDMSHDRFVLDHNRCVLCTRCVRVCDEIEGAHVWDVANRGFKAHIISDLGTPWGDSATCTSCGKCVNVCPTGALVEKGKPVGTLVKRTEFIAYLNTLREAKHAR